MRISLLSSCCHWFSAYVLHTVLVPPTHSNLFCMRTPSGFRTVLSYQEHCSRSNALSQLDVNRAKKAVVSSLRVGSTRLVREALGHPDRRLSYSPTDMCKARRFSNVVDLTVRLARFGGHTTSSLAGPMRGSLFTV